MCEDVDTETRLKSRKRRGRRRDSKEIIYIIWEKRKTHAEMKQKKE
jgi:hypothetical protein